MKNDHPDHLPLRLALGKFGFGGDYNPEQWPRLTRLDDYRLMKVAGVNVVSLGIFSWAMVEPTPGAYDFGWLDEIMDDLATEGIAVSLATMTASPPPWLSALYPDSLPMRADGVRLWPGARQHYCPSSPAYREHAGQLVQALAERYRRHPALRLWHVGNEYGCHVSSCYCDVSAAAFRRWLRQRYTTIHALNAAWSTTFWSQRYSDWEQILPPRTAPTFPNPTQQIDFRRFSSDELLSCYLLERDILRSVTPEVPVTTNFLSVDAMKPLDYYTWAPEVDVVGFDSYPDPHEQESHVGAAFTYDLMRSLRHGEPWLLMEQSPGAVNWRNRNGPKPPGIMRLWTFQAVARGADAVMFFQWRQSRGGAEKHHSAMVPHAGEQSRTFAAVSELGHELAHLAEIVDTHVKASVAIVFDWSSWWGLELDSHPSGELDLLSICISHYRPLFTSGITADIVHPSWDLSDYRLVVVPNLYLVSKADAANLAAYVNSGGHVLMSFFSGVVDTDEQAYTGGAPGPFRELLGLTVDEFWPLRPGQDTIVVLDDGSIGRGLVWSEWIQLDAGQAVASFHEGDLAGRPAVVRNDYGDGVAWYVGTQPDEQTMHRLVLRAAREAGVEPELSDLPNGVETVARHSQDGSVYRFLLNHNDRGVSVPLPIACKDLLQRGDPRAAELIRIPPRGVAVVVAAES